MLDLPKLEGPVRLAVLGGLALLAVAVAVTVAVLVGSSPPPPLPSMPPTTVKVPAAAAQPPAPQPDAKAWPADTEDQVRATQRLLGELKLMDEPASGQPGPVTQAAIRDYQHMAGLEETGEVSEALFDSLKEVAAMVSPKAARSD